MIHCNHNFELNQFLKREESKDEMSEEREAHIKARMKELMEEGKSCDPYGVTIYEGYEGRSQYTYYNLFEAFNEIPESQQKIISEQWKYAHSLGDGYMNLKSNMFDQLDILVRQYWEKQARYILENQL